jgi:hypothetical protein
LHNTEKKEDNSKSSGNTEAENLQNEFLNEYMMEYGMKTDESPSLFKIMKGRR